MFTRSRCEGKFGPLIAERQARALSAADSAALERHLRGCDRCRAWEADVLELVRGIRNASEAGVLDHPAPEKLAALSSGGDALPAEEKAKIEDHLQRCSDCRAEWNVATQWNPVRVPGYAPAARPARAPWGWFGTGALSAAAAAALLFAVVIPRGVEPAIAARPAIETSMAPVQIRGAHHRAASDLTALPVADAAAVVVSLTVEALPGSPLEVELRDAAGKILAAAQLTLDDPSGLLLFSVASSRLPHGAGEFRVRVAGTDESFRYPFRVERSGD